MGPAAAVNALYATGVWLMNAHRTAQAIDVFRAMIVTAPADERGWLGLAAAHDALGEVEVAERLYELGARAAGCGRCGIGRARALRALDRGDEADRVLDDVEQFVEWTDDDAVRALLVYERSVS